MEKIELNYKHIPRYLWVGRNDRFWYSDCQVLLENMFGEDSLRMVCKVLAATSINTSLVANVKLFYKAMHQITNGKELEGYLPAIKKPVRACERR